jgi:amino acid transporter
MIDAKIPEKSARQSLGGLLKELPDRITRLVRSEIQLAKLEVTTKIKAAGVGAGMLAVAAFFALVAFAVLVAAAIMGLANVVPDWLAAIIVAVVFLILAGVLAYLGVKKLKKGIPPVPEDSIDSVKADVRAVTGKDS